MRKPAKKPVKKLKPTEFKYQISTDYLRKVYSVEAFARMLPQAVKKIKAFRKKHPFDAIAFTGSSGSAIAYPLSYMLKLPLICVRKKGDGNHFYKEIEGCINARHYLIVDDFIESGRTMNKIMSTVKSIMPNAKPVGIFLYSDAAYARREDYKNVPIFRMMRDE